MCLCGGMKTPLGTTHNHWCNIDGAKFTPDKDSWRYHKSAPPPMPREPVHTVKLMSLREIIATVQSRGLIRCLACGEHIKATYHCMNTHMVRKHRGIGRYRSYIAQPLEI